MLAIQHLRARRALSRPAAIPPIPAGKNTVTAEALQNQLKYFETIAEHTREPIIAIDENMRISYVNPAFQRLLGYNASDALGRSPLFLKCSQTPSDLYKELRQAIACHTTWQGQLSAPTKAGEVIALEVFMTPVQGVRGQHMGLIAVGRDLTRENQLGAQLQHARKMEAIGTLAGGIAHDFNNILSAIIGYSELAILDEAENKPVKESLKQIVKAAKRAAELITQILTFSRGSRQERQPLYLKPIVSESLKLLRSTLPTSIEIVTCCEKDTPPILADATQMQQIVMNLCTNAAHAMQPHGGTLTVKLFKQALSNTRPLWQEELPDVESCVGLSISDTGHGMTKAIQARIFEPYFTTKHGGDGTGLGLATVHGIINSHNGVIRVESALGQGSTFTILFPACSARAILQQSEAPETALPRGNNERIMVVDDEEPLTTMISTVLTYLGYEVSSFTLSTKALETFAADPDQFDCIISDQTMPSLCGADFAERVFAIRPGMPFILCSGYSDTVDKEKAKELGVAEFVMKPATGRTLAAILDRILHT